MLRESKGNMYDFVTHTWNPIKGKCPHDCSYCYMKRWGEQKPLHLDEKELQTDLGSGNFIFVGSSTDMFAKEVPFMWIKKVLEKCSKFDNYYLFQTKNPYLIYGLPIPCDSVVCTTIETNRLYHQIMGRSIPPKARSEAMKYIDRRKFVTIEPIMDFDLPEMVDLIRECNPIQVNIGADSGNNHLPEPSKEKLLALINELQRFTTIHKKTNLGRILCTN